MKGDNQVLSQFSDLSCLCLLHLQDVLWGLSRHKGKECLGLGWCCPLVVVPLNVFNAVSGLHCHLWGGFNNGKAVRDLCQHSRGNNFLSFFQEMDLLQLMDWLRTILQLVVGLGILNVWLIRANWSTGYRGGDAKNLKEEFATYGLPPWFFYMIGTFKVTIALCLLIGIWVHCLTVPAALGMAALMMGAFSMHLKVKDPLKKAWPSLAMLGMSLLIAFL